MASTTDRFPDARGAHLSHCFQGEYRHSCKYGDDDCPATVNEVADHPNDRTLDLDLRAIALVRHLAASTTQTELEQSRRWAEQLVQEMENDHGTI